MKKIVLSTIATIGLSTVMFAQQAELKSAQANLEKKDYIAAMDDLNRAKKEVTKLISDNLASVLPVKFGEFELGDNEFGGMGMGGVSVNKVYKKPVAKKETTNPDGGHDHGAMDPAMMDPMMAGQQEQITVEITTNMMMASEVMNAHAMSDEGMGGGMPGTNVKPIRVKGYRAIVRTSGGEGSDPMMMGMQKTETAQAIVGGAFISVEARGLEESGQAEKLLGLIDFDKLKGFVGE